MDVNEEFAAKLACVRCGRAVRNKSKWFRLTEQDNGLNFYYRCAKCHSVFQGVATKQMLAQLESLALQDMATFTGASVTSTSHAPKLPREQKKKSSRPRFFRNRQTRKDMERYAGSFEKQLYTEGNDFLSEQVMKEGKNWKSGSD